jgi:tetratricopeptide (TPR) repeat protein
MNTPLPGEEEVSTRPKRQGADQAIQLALESKWEEAAALNRSLLSTHPADVDAWNRLGKALLELGRYRDASDAYSKALDLDPVNSIAKRNIERLATFKDDESLPEGRRGEAVAKVAQDLFIEEVGKSGSSVLRDVPTAVLAGLTAGDEVYLKPSDELISIEDAAGEVIGNLDPKLGLRLLRLIKGGNRYAAAVKSVSENDVELIIKEVYRDPSQTKLSFPAVGGEGVRPYIKESLLRFNADDDEDEIEDEAEVDDWEAEPETTESTVSFSSFQSVIERDVDDEEEEEV